MRQDFFRITMNILKQTARMREEANLRRMATVVRDSNDAITIQDFEGRITAWNRGAELMYGYSEAEALLANIERLTAPGKVAEQKDFIRRLVAGEAITSFETQRVAKDGRVLDVWMTATKLMDDAGKPIGLASTERDITERKRAENELAWNYETQSALHALLNQSMDRETTTTFLAHALSVILSVKWLAIKSCGAIFLVDEERKALHLEAHSGLPKDLLAMCATIPFGRCLCGRAAEAQTIQFADHIDERHGTCYAGMRPHGHYCVPILSGTHLIGVLNLYVEEGHTRNASEEKFLKAVANTLAEAIERKLAEAKLKKQLDELRRWQTVALGREGHILDVKKEVNELLERLGEPPRYASVEAD